MTLAKRRNVVNIFLICFYEMFYRNFLSLNVLKNRGKISTQPHTGVIQIKFPIFQITKLRKLEPNFWI